MDTKVKPTAARAVRKGPPLLTALNQSEQIKDKVEECAQELTSINEVLKHEVTGQVPPAQIEDALQQSEKLEVKVQECADDLTVVNAVLQKEIGQRKKLERKLVESKDELSDTQEVLFDTQTELTDTQVQEKHARHLALHDALTRLPNRHLFNDRLENAMAQAKRHDWRLAVMFIDLDKFKSINDTYGHDAGDGVLKIVSERLKTSVRDADTVARQGGDEFLYLMLEAKEDGDVENAARKIARFISEPCEFDGLKLTVKPSIGIAIYPRDGTTANALLKNADSAMYKAKQGENGYGFYVAP